MIYRTKFTHRVTAWLVCASFAAPLLAGCNGGNNAGANLPPIDDTRTSSANYRPTQEPPQRGMSTGKKVAILAGAAALYYLYKRSQSRQNEGAEGKYYLSKNGRVYYRDKEGRAHWVTPPRQLEVPQEEIDRYPELSRYRGYNNQTTGEAFGGI